MKIMWLGHSSLKILADQTIYIDPYAGEEAWYTPADVVLVSQWHYDHCNVALINKIRQEDTHVLGTTEVARNIYPCGRLMEGESRQFGETEVIATPAKLKELSHRGHDHEPQSALGFVIHANKTVYFLGGAKFHPKMEEIHPDILLIPVGGTYTFTPQDAAECANRINAGLTIPIHWGSIEGTRDNAEYFQELARVPVKILEPGESVEL